MNRRTLLSFAACNGLVSHIPYGFAQGASANFRQGTHLIMLGTMAGPVLHPSRAMCSQMLMVDGKGILIDCGYGALMRMTELGIRPNDIAQLLITHHHSDHNADYAAIVNMAWIAGLRAPMQVTGPHPMQAVHTAALALQREDIDIRIKATGREPIEKSFAVRELNDAGVVSDANGVKITAIRVDHAPFHLALGYRIDTSTTSIVFSGDTAPTDALVQAAKGAHTLVHEAMLTDGIDAMLAKRPYVPPNLKRFLMNGHTTAEDVGKLAAQAGVRRLVLTHLLPGDEPIADAVWRDAAAKHFGGEIVVAKDKMILGF
jgi:ribonuclease BN (tRNA processing enzyme)